MVGSPQGKLRPTVWRSPPRGTQTSPLKTCGPASTPSVVLLKMALHPSLKSRQSAYCLICLKLLGCSAPPLRNTGSLSPPVGLLSNSRRTSPVAMLNAFVDSPLGQLDIMVPSLLRLVLPACGLPNHVLPPLRLWCAMGSNSTIVGPMGSVGMLVIPLPPV